MIRYTCECITPAHIDALEAPMPPGGYKALQVRGLTADQAAGFRRKHRICPGEHHYTPTCSECFWSGPTVTVWADAAEQAAWHNTTHQRRGATRRPPAR